MINKRWTFRRKADLLERLAARCISRGDVAAMGISDEELAEWQQRYAEAGIKGLKQRYRRERRANAR